MGEVGHVTHRPTEAFKSEYMITARTRDVRFRLGLKGGAGYGFCSYLAPSVEEKVPSFGLPYTDAAVQAKPHVHIIWPIQAV